MSAFNRKDYLISSTFPKYCGRIIAATLASTLSSFVDGCITGKMLGAGAMAAFGIAMPFILLLIVVPGIILSSGGSICCSRLLGENNNDRANDNFTACCTAGTAVGIIGAVICLTCPELIMKLTGATGNVASEAAAYMRGYSLGAIPTILLSILMYYANLDGHENMSLIAVAIMTVTDIVLDLVLGVHMGLGMLGMALATSISYIFATAYFVFIFLKGKSSYSLSFKNQKAELINIVKFGYSSALNTLLISARCFLINMLLISIAGQIAVTAYSFQSNFNQFFVAIASGISTTVSALTGIFIGEKDRTKVYSSVSTGFKLGIILSAGLMVILFFGAPLFTELLMDGTEIEKQCSVSALRFFSLSMPFSTVCIVFIAFYQTLGSRKLANIIAVGHGLVFIILSAFILSSFMGLDGVWLSTLVGELLMLILLFIYVWLHEHRMPRRPADMIIMDENLLEDEEDVYRAAAKNGDVAGINSVRSGLEDYLKKYSITEKVYNAYIDACDMLMRTSGMMQNTDTVSSALNNTVRFVDVQSYMTGSSKNDVNINIRFTGEHVYKVLDSGAGKMINEKIRESDLRLHYRFGADISFVNIRKGEDCNE